MRNLPVLSCSVATLLSLLACGSGTSKPAPANPQPTPSQTPAPGSNPMAPDLGNLKPAPSGESAPSGTQAPSPAQAPGGAPAPSAAPTPQDPPAKPLPRVRVDQATVKTLFGRDPAADEVDNPSTPEKVALGKALYTETHLSKNGNVSCASCHDLTKYGVDGKPLSTGSEGKDALRSTPTIYNAARQFRQFWDGRAATVEELVVGHVLDPLTHGLADEAQLTAKIKDKAPLVEAFKKAFPGDADAVTVANFRLAIGAFARTLVTKSKFDAYLDGDAKALGNDELYGLKAFIDVGCLTCHVTRLVGGHMFQKTGLLKPYGSKDEGRMALTKSDADKFLFKVPTLLNVEKTAPYFHDGKAKTLEEAVTTMAEIQLDKRLTPEQLRGLVAFLKALTGPLPAEFAAAK